MLQSQQQKHAEDVRNYHQFLQTICPGNRPNTQLAFYGRIRDEDGCVNLFGMRGESNIRIMHEAPPKKAFANRCTCGGFLHDEMCGSCGSDYLPC